MSRPSSLVTAFVYLGIAIAAAYACVQLLRHPASAHLAQWPVRFVSVRQMCAITIRFGDQVTQFVNRGMHTGANESITSESPIDCLDQALSKTDCADWTALESPNARLRVPSFNYLIGIIHRINLQTPVLPQAQADEISKYGLNPPAASIEIDWNGGNLKVMIGDYNSFLKKRYAKVVGTNAVYAIESGLFEAASKNLAWYIE